MTGTKEINTYRCLCSYRWLTEFAQSPPILLSTRQAKLTAQVRTGHHSDRKQLLEAAEQIIVVREWN